MARNGPLDGPGFQLLASAPRVSSGITRKAALGLPVWFSRSCLGTDARRRHPCPARTPGWAGLHRPEPWDRLPARCSPTEGLPGPAALATALPCAFCQGLRRRPRARVGRGGMLTPAGCFPRRTRPVTCTLSFGDSRFLGPHRVTVWAHPRVLASCPAAGIPPAPPAERSLWRVDVRSEVAWPGQAALRPRRSRARSAGALDGKPPETAPPKPSPEAWPQTERWAKASWRQD